MKKFFIGLYQALAHARTIQAINMIPRRDREDMGLHTPQDIYNRATEMVYGA